MILRLAQAALPIGIVATAAGMIATAGTGWFFVLLLVASVPLALIAMYVDGR